MSIWPSISENNTQNPLVSRCESIQNPSHIDKEPHAFNGWTETGNPKIHILYTLRCFDLFDVYLRCTYIYYDSLFNCVYV